MIRTSFLMECEDNLLASWGICEEDLAQLTDSTIFSSEGWTYGKCESEMDRGEDRFFSNEGTTGGWSESDDPIIFIDGMIKELVNNVKDSTCFQTAVARNHMQLSDRRTLVSLDQRRFEDALESAKSTHDDLVLDQTPATLEGLRVAKVLSNANSAESNHPSPVKTPPCKECREHEKQHPCDQLKDLNLTAIGKLFHLPIAVAAKQLGVGATVLKKKCRKLGIPRWPYRKLKSMDNVSNNLERFCRRTIDSEEKVHKLQDILKMQKEAMIQEPSLGFDPETRKLRQELFKHGYKYKQAQLRAQAMLR